MNKKAFTLIELLAVVVILMILITIITPKIFKQLKNAEQITDREQINAIIDISKIYMNQRSNLLPQENDLYVITLNELKESGLIKSSQILNPSTNEELTGCIIVNYANNKYIYEYNEDKCDKVATLTFDANGGQVNQTTKNVILGDEYGTLPTPTKEGYAFKGWTGKNMLNMQEWLDSFTRTARGTMKKGENSITITANYDDAYTNSYDSKESYIIFVKPNTTYTLSWKSDNSSVDGRVYVFVNKLLTSGYIFYEDNALSKSLTFTTPADAEYITFRVGVNSSGNSITFSDMQLEVGDSTTDYEPYQLYTKDTEVTKRENDALYAEWNPIYTIAYNGNGETSGFTQSSTHIYNEDKTLTPNEFEKTGYYFTGWSTSPDDVNIIYDNNEYRYDNTSGSTYVDFKQYTVQGPFQTGDIYQLDVDIKGTGSLNNYFYGASGYLQVASSANSHNITYYSTDGNTPASLTQDYKHYWVRFTLGSNGDGSVTKYLLFRVLRGNSVSIKNIRLYKVSSKSHAYVDEQSVKRLSLTQNDTVNLYAIWQANS